MNSLGIIGGGQLGMFLCQAAKDLGNKTSIFSETEEFSAKSFCDKYFIGKFSNSKILKSFINSADNFTIETENIPFDITKNCFKKKNFS